MYSDFTDFTEDTEAGVLPTSAQEDAYAQGLLLSPDAAELWATTGYGPDPAAGPIDREEVFAFEADVRAGLYDQPVDDATDDSDSDGR